MAFEHLKDALGARRVDDIVDSQDPLQYESFRRVASSVAGRTFVTGAVVGYLDEIWPRLSDEQKEQIIAAATLLYT